MLKSKYYPEQKGYPAFKSEQGDKDSTTTSQYSKVQFSWDNRR